MFFELNINGEKADLVSYIISKHPKTIFERKVGGRGKIEASFETYLENKIKYVGWLGNDSLPFLKCCRELNLGAYVNSEQYSVCPYNLELINTVFRSVLRGKFVGISQEDFDREYNIDLIIGPFSVYKIEPLMDSLRECGYDVLNQGHGAQGNIAHVLHILGKKNLTTFLQQVYVLCYAYTSHLKNIIPQKQDVDKYTELSKGWIQDHPDKDQIRNRLSKVKRNKERFEGNLLRAEGFSEKETQEKVEEKINACKEKASELRYRTIIKMVKDLDKDKILDFGCGSGNLIHRLLRTIKLKKLIGFDSDRKCVDTAKLRGLNQLRKTKKNNTKDINFRVYTGSILYPDYSLFEDVDVVILSEVLEHFHTNEIDRVLDIIFKGLSPECVILTTPNKDYNVNFENHEDGKLRHPDHKFELTKDEVDELAVKVLTKYGYRYSFWRGEFIRKDAGGNKYLDTHSSTKPIDELSHIILFQKQDEVSYGDTSFIEENKCLYTPFDLDASAYRISSKIIREGSSTFNHKVDPRWIVSLTPNMSPADSSAIAGYLEHPYEGIDYYESRGVKELVVETKYMGSNGTIVATMEKDISQKLFGSNDLINIYSRKGYRFFDDKQIENRIYEEIRSFMKFLGCNVIVLEAEILPWLYKAGTMIEKEFIKPGYCALIDKQYAGRDASNEQLYLRSLNNYIKDSDIKIHPYKILLDANFDGKKFRKINNGNYCFHDYQLDLFGNLWTKSNLFGPVDYMYYIVGKSNLNDVLAYWEMLESMGLEGIVIKPRYPTAFLTSGRYIQPALKCRTREYLRIIYGIDYLQEENLSFLKRRKTAHKRKLAMQQWELSQKILYSFINMNSNQRLKYIFSFFGMERVSNIDNTL